METPRPTKQTDTGTNPEHPGHLGQPPSGNQVSENASGDDPSHSSSRFCDLFSASLSSSLALHSSLTGCIARRAAQQLGTAWEKSFSAYCLRRWLKPWAHRLAGLVAAMARKSFAFQLLQRDLTAESWVYRKTREIRKAASSPSQDVSAAPCPATATIRTATTTRTTRGKSTSHKAAQPPSTRAYARWALLFSLLAALLLAGGAIIASRLAASSLYASSSLLNPTLLQQLAKGILALAMLLLALAVLWRTEVGIYAAVVMLPFVPFKALFLLALLTLASLFFHVWRNQKHLRKEQEWEASIAAGIGTGNAVNNSANRAGNAANSGANKKSWGAISPALPPTLLPIGLFFAVLFYATVTSVSFWTSASEFLIPVTGLIYLLVILACFDSEEKLENLLVLLALAGFLATAYAIYYYYTGPSILDIHKEWVDLTRNPDIRNRAYAVFENPNLLAQFCVQLTALALGGLFAARRPARRMMFVLAAAAASLCLLLTYSRGGWIAWAVAIAVFGLFQSPGFTLAALPAGGALLYGVAPTSIHHRLATAASLQDSSNAFRVDTWNSTLALVKAHWLSGVGLGRLAFVRVYATHMINNNSVPHSHNLYLQLVSEFGILGLAVFLWLMWRLFRLGLKIRAGSSTFARSVTAGAMGALAGLLAHSVIDYFLWYYKLGILLWLVIALVIVFERTHHAAVSGTATNEENILTMDANGIPEEV